jgi:lysozyme
MNGIDVSRWQKRIDLSKVPADFVIVKATQGVSYKSPTFEEQIRTALSAGRLIGVYHYASQGGAINEAEHFLSDVGPYIGTAILCLDWEKDENPNFTNPSYAVAFLKYVEQRTGIKPFIYMSKSVCRTYASVWDPTFPLWCAQYANHIPTGYKDNPWTDAKGFGPWACCQIFQYSSVGFLSGYLGRLDLDKAYITADDWRAFAQGKAQIPAIPWQIGKVYTTLVNLNIRDLPNGKKSKFAELTADAKRHAYTSNGTAVLQKGTRVTVKAIDTVGSDIWIRIPSGWICGKQGNKIYVI